MHRLFLRMMMAPMKEVRSAYIMRVRAERGGSNRGRSAMLDYGFEEVIVPDAITPDGREVVTAYGRRWALRPEIHAERLAQAFEMARQTLPQSEDKDTKSVVGTESLSSMVCPKCGDSLQHTAVCPRCAAGKLGYRHRYTCACGGADLVSKESL